MLWCNNSSMSPSPELDQNLNLEAVVFSIVKLFQFRVCAEQCSGLAASYAAVAAQFSFPCRTWRKGSDPAPSVAFVISIHTGVSIFAQVPLTVALLLFPVQSRVGSWEDQWGPRERKNSCEARFASHHQSRVRIIILRLLHESLHPHPYTLPW